MAITRDPVDPGVSLLSLHFTFECDRHCTFCYMKAKNISAMSIRDLAFFMEFPRVARTLKISQIALGGGEPTLFPTFLHEFSMECKNQNIALTLTTNGANVTEENADDLRLFSLVSFSIDSEKVKEFPDLANIFRKIEILKRRNINTGVNLLLDDGIIGNLFNLTSLIKKYTENVYFLQLKPSNVVETESLKKALLQLRLFHSNLFIDDSLQLSFGTKECCSRGREFVSVSPYGDLSYCSFDQPFASLHEATDLGNLLEKHYPREKTTRCPFI